MDNLSKLLRNEAAQKPIMLIFTKHCFSTFQYETLFRDSESLKQGMYIAMKIRKLTKILTLLIKLGKIQQTQTTLFQTK